MQVEEVIDEISCSSSENSDDIPLSRLVEIAVQKKMQEFKNQKVGYMYQAPSNVILDCRAI